MDFSTMTIAQLRTERASRVAAIKALHDKAKAEKREHNDEESEQILAADADIKTIDPILAAKQAERNALASTTSSARAVEAVTPQPRRVAAQPAQEDGRPVRVVKENREDDPLRGYKNHRAFLLDVLEAGRTGRVTELLRPMAVIGSDEQSQMNDPFGGFLVPEGMSPDLLSVGADEDPTAGLVTQVPMALPTLKINARVDKDHSTSVSGGLTVSRTAEMGAFTPSRMQFEQVKLEATKLTGLTYVTEELLERSPISFVALLQRGFSDEFGSKMIDERISGTGVGEPEGVLTSAATIKVARAGAGAISAADITGIRKRVWRYPRAIWLANQDTYDELAAAHIAGTNSDVFLFSPERGEDVPATLLSRPIFFVEHVPGLGTEGDLGCYVWSEYLWGTLNPLRSAESIHVRFVNHERTFKFWIENDGKPWWKSALTPKNGAATLSPFVVLTDA